MAVVLKFPEDKSYSEGEKIVLQQFVNVYNDKLLQNPSNERYLQQFAQTILKILQESNPCHKESMINAFFSTTKAAPNCKDLPLDPATKKKCLIGLATGFALLAASVLAVAVNPVLSIAVAAVAVGVLLTSTAVLLNGGPMLDYKSEERTILEVAKGMNVA